MKHAKPPHPSTISWARRVLGWTQQYAAFRIGCSIRSVANYESGLQAKTQALIDKLWEMVAEAEQKAGPAPSHDGRRP